MSATYLLPRHMSPIKEAYESLGFIFNEVVDNHGFDDIDPNTYYEVTLPEGWKIVPNVSSWFNIFDEAGKKRVTYTFNPSVICANSMHMLKP